MSINNLKKVLEQKKVIVFSPQANKVDFHLVFIITWYYFEYSTIEKEHSIDGPV